jgi:pimeloyl-ACP methyl ester carboxylesterase
MGAPRPHLHDVSGRVIAYDRRGYGESGVPQPYTGTTVSEQAEDLAALVTRSTPRRRCSSARTSGRSSCSTRCCATAG